MRVVLFLLTMMLAATGIRAAYDKVTQDIVAPNPSARLDFHATSVAAPDFSAVNNLIAKPLPGTQDGFASNIATQNQQFNNRMEDLRNYARNPAGWHGAPPH